MVCGLVLEEWEHLVGEDDAVAAVLVVALHPMESDLELWELLVESSSLDCMDTVGAEPDCGT